LQNVYAGVLISIIKALINNAIKIPLRRLLIFQLQFSPNHPKHYYQSEPPTPMIEPPDKLIVETIGGALSVGIIEMLMAPLNLIEQALQTNSSYINGWDAAIKIYSQFGLKGFYSGCSIYFIHQAAFYAVYYPLYVYLKKTLFTQGDKMDAKKGRTQEEYTIVRGEQKSRPFSLMTSLLVSGIVGGLVTYPLYSLKVQYNSHILANGPSSLFSFLKSFPLSSISMDMNGIFSHSLRYGTMGACTLLFHKIFGYFNTPNSNSNDDSDENKFNYPTFRDIVFNFFKPQEQ